MQVSPAGQRKGLLLVKKISFDVRLTGSFEIFIGDFTGKCDKRLHTGENRECENAGALHN